MDCQSANGGDTGEHRLRASMPIACSIRSAVSIGNSLHGSATPHVVRHSASDSRDRVEGCRDQHESRTSTRVDCSQPRNLDITRCKVVSRTTFRTSRTHLSVRRRGDCQAQRLLDSAHRDGSAVRPLRAKARARAESAHYLERLSSMDTRSKSLLGAQPARARARGFGPMEIERSERD